MKSDITEVLKFLWWPLEAASKSESTSNYKRWTSKVNASTSVRPVSAAPASLLFTYYFFHLLSTLECSLVLIAFFYINSFGIIKVFWLKSEANAQVP